MAGIKITLVDDVASFLRGTQRAEEALDDVADSLDDLARDAQKQGRTTGDDLAKGIDRGTDRAADSVEDLERSFRDLAKAVQRETKKAGDDLGDNVKRGAREAEQGMEDLNDNAASNAKEFAASWDGSAQGAIDSLQGFAAEATEGFGPIGLAAGVALAAGAGAMYTAWQEKSEATKQAVADMYQDMLESGQNYLSAEFVQQNLADIYESADGAAISYENLLKAVQTTGIEESTLARAFAGDSDARAAAMAALRDAYANVTADAGTFGKQAQASYQENKLAIQDVIEALDGQAANQQTATDRVEGYRQAVAGLPDKKVTDLEVNTQPGRMGMGDFYRDPQVFHGASVPITADTSEAERVVQQWMARPRRVGVAVSAGVQRVM